MLPSKPKEELEKEKEAQDMRIAYEGSFSLELPIVQSGLQEDCSMDVQVVDYMNGEAKNDQYMSEYHSIRVEQKQVEDKSETIGNQFESKLEEKEVYNQMYNRSVENYAKLPRVIISLKKRSKGYAKVLVDDKNKANYRSTTTRYRPERYSKTKIIRKEGESQKIYKIYSKSKTEPSINFWKNADINSSRLSDEVEIDEDSINERANSVLLKEMAEIISSTYDPETILAKISQLSPLIY